jgi:hypothetical protein
VCVTAEHMGGKMVGMQLSPVSQQHLVSHHHKFRPFTAVAPRACRQRCSVPTLCTTWLFVWSLSLPGAAMQDPSSLAG